MVLPREDDSHTNMKWLVSQNLLLGSELKGRKKLHVGIDTLEFELQILDSKLNIIDKTELNGKSKKVLFEWIKNELANRKINTEDLSMKLHFQILTSF